MKGFIFVFIFSVSLFSASILEVNNHDSILIRKDAFSNSRITEREIINVKESELSNIITNSETLSKDEKKYWLGKLPNMNKYQRDKLSSILIVSKLKIKDLSLKLKMEILEEKINNLMIERDKLRRKQADILETINTIEKTSR